MQHGHAYGTHVVTFFIYLFFYIFFFFSKILLLEGFVFSGYGPDRDLVYYFLSPFPSCLVSIDA